MTLDYLHKLSFPKEQPCIITVTGSGGKSTILEEIAHYLLKQNHKVLMTTTTQIWIPSLSQAVTILDLLNYPSFLLKEAQIIYSGSSVTESHKLNGYTPTDIHLLQSRNQFDYLLIEGDGSKGKPLKAHAHYEPVIPDNSHIHMAVMGLQALGLPVNQNNVHRLDLFCQITGKNDGDLIEALDFIHLCQSPHGYFKNHHNNQLLILNRLSPKNKQAAHYIKQTVLKTCSHIKDVLFREEI